MKTLESEISKSSEKLYVSSRRPQKANTTSESDKSYILYRIYELSKKKARIANL